MKPIIPPEVRVKTRNTFLSFHFERQNSSDGDGGSSSRKRCSSEPCLVCPAGPAERYGSTVTNQSVVSTVISKTELEQLHETSAVSTDNYPLKVFVGSLPSFCDERCLTRFMSFFGEVKNVSLKRNQQTGISRRYGYVKFRAPPREEIFTQSWCMGDKPIQVRRYQANPCWKNAYMSENESDEAAGGYVCE